MFRFCVWLLIALLTPHVSQGDEWPQWRGANRDDLSGETGLLQTWPEGGPPQVWLYRECGLGYGGPAIANGRIYIMGSRDGTELLMALDEANGAELWNVPLGEELENDWGNGPRGTPTVHGDKIYALAAKGTLSCIGVGSGELIWSKPMQELRGEVPNWGYSESPLVHQDRLICTPGGKNGAIVALNRENGELIWQTNSLTPKAHYSSPILVERAGKLEVIQLLQNQLVGVDFETGAVNWRVPWPGKVAVVPTPIARGSMVYCSSAYGAGSMLVEVSPDGRAKTVYENKVMKNQHGGVILHGDHLYGHSDGAGWVCQAFTTGESVWRERDALGKGAIAYADGRFYCLDESSGEVALIAASPEKWQEYGRLKLDPQTELRKPRGKIWTHPVISGGRLYLRDQELLFSFDVSDAARKTAAAGK